MKWMACSRLTDGNPFRKSSKVELPSMWSISAWIGTRVPLKQGMETKQQILKAIEELPDDAGVEEAQDRLYLIYKIERGLRKADCGELLTQEEVSERVSKWAK